MAKQGSKEYKTIQRYLKHIIKAARIYDNLYRNKEIRYHYLEEDGSTGELKIQFKAGNFMHLCGVTEYYKRSARQFLSDALKSRIQINRVNIRSVSHFMLKIKSLPKLQDMIQPGSLGVVDQNIVHNNLEVDQMIRMQGEDAIAIGTRPDDKGKNVPITMINIPLAQDGLKRQMRTFKPVMRVDCRDI